ncbi:hypothetical protein QE392_002535 [Microbacterium proteolyticum]|nr:hypothetical protein [Microbacterium sp. SORGH_AS_0344]MDQ1170731.1 hypothetical protein [Microbacterium proteolyticum]
MIREPFGIDTGFTAAPVLSARITGVTIDVGMPSRLG